MTLTLKRSAVLALTAFALLGVTGCGGATDASSPSASPSATAEQSSPYQGLAGRIIADKTAGNLTSLARDGVQPSGNTLQNRHGSYPELEVVPDGPLATPGEAYRGALPKGWTSQDVNAATVLASNFVLQHIVDSPANGDPEQLPHEADRVRSLLHSQDRDGLSDADLKGMLVLQQEVLADYLEGQAEQGYAYLYDGQIPRLNDFSVTIKEATAFDDGTALMLRYGGSFAFDAKANSARGWYTESHRIKALDVAVAKDGDRFAITGTQLDTTEPTVQTVAIVD